MLGSVVHSRTRSTAQNVLERESTAVVFSGSPPPAALALHPAQHNTEEKDGKTRASSSTVTREPPAGPPAPSPRHGSALERSPRPITATRLPATRPRRRPRHGLVHRDQGIVSGELDRLCSAARACDRARGRRIALGDRAHRSHGWADRVRAHARGDRTRLRNISATRHPSPPPAFDSHSRSRFLLARHGAQSIEPRPVPLPGPDSFSSRSRQPTPPFLPPRPRPHLSRLTERRPSSSSPHHKPDIPPKG